ncbi:MAG: efflux RND transporter permease subunit, partial [Gammaproteobacteria bacterium]|nr:efflux RND transporter permease subunit [Gammaproteobacteria bacterium]
LGIMLGLTPPAEYLPEGEEPKTFARMIAPPGYNLDAMKQIGERIQADLLPHVDADPDAFARGDADVPALRYFNMGIDPQGLRIIAEPVRPSQIDDLMAALRREYEAYPGMRTFISRGSIITSNEGGTRSVNLDISGPSLAEIFDVALAAYRRSAEVFDQPRIQANPSTLSLAQPLIEIRPDWERSSELGMSASDLGYTVAALTDGAFVDEFFLSDDKIDIYLYSSAGTNAQLGSLEGLPVYTALGTVLPLGALASVVETVDTSLIRRVNGDRAVTLNVIPPEEIALETGVAIVRRDIVGYLRELGQIPASVTIDISGASDQLQATRESLQANFLVALVIIYLVLAAIFTHWGYPLLIMVTIPLGLAGGIFGLWLFNSLGSLLPLVGLNTAHQAFDMISMLGFLILMGTVVNNPILIVHRAMENVRHARMEAVAAVREAVEARLRPIAMSTITTIAGLSPLVLLPGAGTELYRGVGIIVMFGIIGAALVTLTMLPCLAVFVLQFAERVGRDKRVTPSRL